MKRNSLPIKGKFSIKKYAIPFFIFIMFMISCNKAPLNPADPIESVDQLNVTKSRFGADLLWFGSDQSRTNERVLSAFSNEFKSLNLNITRFDVYWGNIERVQGEYNWEIPDLLVSSVPAGTKIVFTLYSASPWVKYSECRANVLTELGKTNIDITNRPPSSIPKPEYQENYRSFLRAIVERYRDRVEFWQIENEVFGVRNMNITNCPSINHFWIGTPEEYTNLLQQSYREIKKFDPNLKVLLSGIASGGEWPPKDFDPTFLDTVLNESEAYFDIVDLHLYGDLYDIPLRINAIKAKLPHEKPLWSTESGEIDIRVHTNPLFSLSFDAEEELKLQAEEIVKRHVIAFVNGIEMMTRLRINPMLNDESPENTWFHMGITSDVDGKQKKPAYYSYRYMVEKLNGFDSVEKLNLGEHIYQFTINGRKVIVAWDDNAGYLDLSKLSLGDNIAVTKIVTQENQTSLEQQEYTETLILLTSSPIFVEE